MYNLTGQLAVERGLLSMKQAYHVTRTKAIHECLD